MQHCPYLLLPLDSSLHMEQNLFQQLTPLEQNLFDNRHNPTKIPPPSLSGIVSSEAPKTKPHKLEMHTLNKMTCRMNQKIFTERSKIN